MPTKNQHYVPRVYLKAWETKVETNKEPTKQFDGVYFFENGATVAEGRTIETILWEPHLYTISFRQLYIADKCPKVYSYFVEKVYEPALEPDAAAWYNTGRKEGWWHDGHNEPSGVGDSDPGGKAQGSLRLAGGHPEDLP